MNSLIKILAALALVTSVAACWPDSDHPGDNRGPNDGETSGGTSPEDAEGGGPASSEPDK